MRRLGGETRQRFAEANPSLDNTEDPARGTFAVASGSAGTKKVCLASHTTGFLQDRRVVRRDQSQHTICVHTQSALSSRSRDFRPTDQDRKEGKG